MIQNVKADSLADVFTDSTLSAFTQSALNKGVTNDSIIYITCDSGDSDTFGSQFITGSNWIWAKGELFNGNLDQFIPITEEEIDALFNNIDINNKYIEFSINGNIIKAYRYSEGDITSPNIPDSYGTADIVLCFSKYDGTKYFIPYVGIWSESSGSINLRTSVYDSSNSIISQVSGGSIISEEEGEIENYNNCSLRIPLVSGDITMYDYDNNTTISPTYYAYTDSGPAGTSFISSAGQGIVYEDSAYYDIKSISGYVYIDTTKSGNQTPVWGAVFALISHGQNWNPNYGIYWDTGFLTWYDSSNTVRIPTSGYDGNGADVSVQASIRGSWHKFCLTTTADWANKNDTSSGSFEQKLYLDGQLLITNTGGSYTYSHAPRGFIIGNSWRLKANGTASRDTNALSGTVKEFRLYRRTLTDAEAIIESTI